jgi:hypothetical protein
VPPTETVKSTSFKGAIPELGLAAREQESVGIGLFTLTVAEQSTDPPAPEQVNVYVEYEDGETL